MTRLTGTMISRALPAKRALNSMNSLPSLSELVASKLMFSTISPFFTYSRGTWTESSTCTATYGVRPLSVHQSYSARIRYGRVDVDSRAFIVVAAPRSLLAHHLFGRRQCLDVGRAREDALGVLEERRRVLGELDAIVVHAPQQRRDGDVEHREVLAQHVLVLQEHRGQLRQAVADVRAGLLQRLLVALGRARLQRRHVHEQFLLEIEQEETHAGAVHRVAGHQLRMREALVDVLVDDVRLVQDQVALDQDGDLAVRVHDVDVFRLVVQVDVTDLEVHAFFEQHEAAAMGKRAGRSRIQDHHGERLLKIKKSGS